MNPNPEAFIAVAKPAKVTLAVVVNGRRQGVLKRSVKCVFGLCWALSLLGCDRHVTQNSDDLDAVKLIDWINVLSCDNFQTKGKIPDTLNEVLDTLSTRTLTARGVDLTPYVQYLRISNSELFVVFTEKKDLYDASGTSASLINVAASRNDYYIYCDCLKGDCKNTIWIETPAYVFEKRGRL